MENNQKERLAPGKDKPNPEYATARTDDGTGVQAYSSISKHIKLSTHAQRLDHQNQSRQPKPHTRENRKAIYHHDIPTGMLVFCGYQKLTPLEEAILHAKPCTTEKPLSKNQWPKQEPSILAEWKENPSTREIVKRIPVSQLRTLTFYGDEPNE